MSTPEALILAALTMFALAAVVWAVGPVLSGWPKLSPRQPEAVAAMTDRDQLRRLLADTASLPGRWHWAGNAKHHTVTLSTWVPGYGRVDVLSCRRAGMHGAEFRFCDPDSMMLQPVRELVQYEVCHAATSPDDPRVYRHDIDDVRHPDARLIVAAVNALPGLLDQLDSMEAELADYRAEDRRKPAARWADLFGAAPNYTGGVPVDEWLEAHRAGGAS